MSDNQPATILIVDDEETVAKSYQIHLQDEYETRIATNGGEALVELSPEVDVVLLDRRMPGMNGDEVLDHVHQWGSNCRVIIVSAIEPDTDIIEKRFSQYLTKPIEREELHDAIEQVQLIDRYEELVSQHHEAVEKYSVLQTSFDADTLENNNHFQELKGDINELRDEIADTVDRLSDDNLKNLLSLDKKLN